MGSLRAGEKGAAARARLVNARDCQSQTATTPKTPKTLKTFKTPKTPKTPKTLKTLRDASSGPLAAQAP